MIEQAGNKPRGGALWKCVCACGTAKRVLGSDLRRGLSKSCGCLGSRATIGERSRTHGARDSRLYTTWRNMRARCADMTNPAYGGRGVTVCAEWADFAAFQQWALAKGYRDDLTIERRDVELGYSPGNCEWVPQPEQAKNKTTSVKAPDGRLWVDIAVENGITRSAFRCRVSAGGWTHEEAATHPLGVRRAERSRDDAGRFKAEDGKSWAR